MEKIVELAKQLAECRVRVIRYSERSEDMARLVVAETAMIKARQRYEAAVLYLELEQLIELDRQIGEQG